MSSLLKNLLSCSLISSRRVLPGLLEFVICAVLPAKNYSPGQFFKIKPLLAEEGALPHIILYPAQVDKEKGLIKFTLSLQSQSALYFESNLHKASSIDVIGPSGASYDLDLSTDNNYLIIAESPAYTGGMVYLANVLPAGANIDFIMCYGGDALEYYSKFLGENCDIYKTIERAAKKRAQYSKIFISGSKQLVDQCAALFDYAEMACNLNSRINCAMGGVCGSCITYIDDKTPVFGCIRAHYVS